MMQHVVIGQYFPGSSFLHKMDARAKLLAVVLLVVIVFFANNLVSYGVLAGTTAVLVWLSGVPIRYLAKGLFPVFILILFTFFIHFFFTNEGDELFELGAFTVHEGGVWQGVYISTRIGSLVVLTSLLTLTTTPIDLTDALEQLLSPFKRFGLPAHEMALMMSITIRLIPTLLQETEKILKAQSARGADFVKGSLKDRSRSIIALIIPLFARSFQRAEHMATAMEARGYNGGEGRTKLRVLEWGWRDSWGCFLVIVFGVVLWMMRT
ncbi:energy-coupling factor transporter transmembrane component T family protein [Salsuginibacillus kocurii]|uniref:energy-coupling factor transporter transmembrane component T family protein n=1 Tax=Salsuginibacillus kocurii TaxID=427078 RepID=UPI00036D29A7|nr:energy-coupling factor transporter transmembrane protein EcfT [Salsuginibacillus kocurii]